MFLFALVALASARDMAFQNGKVVALNSTPSATCTSAISTLFLGYQEALNASAITNCEIGVGLNRTTGMYPRYDLVPSFAGLSIYGLTGWNATAQGYPIYNGMAVVTACGADGTPAACNTSIKRNYYSVGHSSLEAMLGITRGTNGLLQGVLPNAAHDSLIPSNVGIVPTQTYVVRIGVYDPNIFPNATTGRCTQLVASNLSSPLKNCLNSTAALARALNTTDSAVAIANKNNIVFKSKNIAPYQAALFVDNVTQTRSMMNGSYMISIVSQPTKNVNASNTNLVKTTFLGPTPTTTVVTTVPTTVPTTIVSTVPPVATPSGGLTATTYAAIAVVVLLIIIIIAYAAMKEKKAAKEKHLAKEKKHEREKK
jgi:hypothetical protein